TTTISFPFPVSVYGQTFTGADVSSNGTLNLIPSSNAFTHGCVILPSSFWEMSILAYQNDLRTDAQSGCAGFLNGECGVFTSTTGSGSNRRFNIEWRATHFLDVTKSANFEIVFYENEACDFYVIYRATSDNGLDETSGVQASSTGSATTFSCGTATLTDGLKVEYSCAECVGATPTPTATAVGTATPTPTCPGGGEGGTPGPWISANP